MFRKYSGRIDTAVRIHYMDDKKTYGDKAWRKLHRNAASNMEHVFEVAPHKAAPVGTLTNHHENNPR